MADTADIPYPAPLAAPWSAVLGVLGSALAVAAPVLPWADAATPVAWAGFLLAGLGGLAGKPPDFLDGRPLVQGAWLTVASTGLVVVQQLWAAGVMPPAGWPQSLALFGVGLLAWAAGKPLPHLGATTNVRLEAPAPTPPGGGS